VVVPIFHGKYPGNADEPLNEHTGNITQQPDQPESEENADEYNSVNAG
jgi:hypothetical protein